MFTPNMRKSFYARNKKLNNMTFQDICWPQHSSSLNNMTMTRKRHDIRFIHHRLPTGKMQFGLKYINVHIVIFYSITTPIMLEVQKSKKGRVSNTSIDTPPNIRQHILHHISQYYQNTQQCKQQYIYIYISVFKRHRAHSMYCSSEQYRMEPFHQKTYHFCFSAHRSTLLLFKKNLGKRSKASDGKNK